MSQIFSFHGGIHPPENKNQSNGRPIQLAPLPEKLYLPLQQHIGAPAEPLVKVGDKVLKGQMIAQPIGRISAAIHAPSSGVVTAIEERPIPHQSGLTSPCIIIETDGEDQWIERQPLEDYKSLNKAELIGYIRDCGVAGMGGAGFPTDVKLHLGEDHIVNTLIINAAECEPYITADDMLMRERADEVISGIEVIAHLLQPSHIMIGIEDNKPQAIRALEQAITGSELNIDVAVVPTKYPSGGEKQLIKLLTDVEVPSGRIPADVGIVCQNVGTTTAIHRAVHLGEPLISRVITLTGEALDSRCNYDALIGTPFSTLLEASGLRSEQLYRLVVGGPMMGFAVENDSIPMVKTTNCLIAATEQEMPEADPANPCIRCGMCEQVCPAELLPQQLHWFAQGREFEKAKHHNLFDCIECGACSYVCPSNIPLVQYYRFAKSEIRLEEAEQRKAEHAKKRFEARQARIEAEAAEKEARRKARSAEAARKQAAKKDTVAAKPAAKAGSADDIKALKTAAAVARTKLKKAEKALAQGKEAGAENLAELETALTEAKQKAEQAQQKLETAEKGGSPADAKPDLKQLKTNAAVARTKLKQAEKALKNAEEKGLEGSDKLRETVVTLTAKAEAAQQAYEQAQAPTTPVAVDTKQLKVNAAVTRTKLKKAEKELQKAIDAGDDNIDQLQATVAEAKAKAEAAQQAFEQAESGTVATPAVDQAKIDGLKEDMDKAAAKVEKARTALDKAIADNSPAAEKMKAGVEKLQAKFEEARAAYEQANSATAAPQSGASEQELAALHSDMEKAAGKVEKAKEALQKAIDSNSPAAEKMKAGVEKLQGKYEEARAAFEQANTGSPAASNGLSEAELESLRSDMEKAAGKVEKAKEALQKAIDNNSPAAEKMKAGVEKLQGKYEEARQTYQQASDNQPAQPGADLTELQEDLDKAWNKVLKAREALEKAISSNSPAAEKMKAGVAKLEDKHQQLKQEFLSAGGTLAPEEEPEAIVEVDLKQLKQQVSIMRTKLRKAEKQLEESDDQDRSAIRSEIDNLQQRYQSAQQQYDEAEAALVTEAAAEGIDLKQLKIDAAMARASVTKVKRALEKARQESAEDLSELQQALSEAEQKSESLNETLSRFE